MAKKEKKTPAEIERERQDRIDKTTESLKITVIQLEGKKDILLSKVVEARRDGLESQEKQARSALGQCLSSLKQVKGMLMTLELAVQTRDIALINQGFMECIGALSDDIRVSASKTDAKKAEKKYLKSVYAAKKQSEDVNRMLEIGQFASAVSVGASVAEEFESEIDTMVENAESGSYGTSTLKPNKKLQ